MVRILSAVLALACTANVLAQSSPTSINRDDQRAVRRDVIKPTPSSTDPIDAAAIIGAQFANDLRKATSELTPNQIAVVNRIIEISQNLERARKSENVAPLQELLAEKGEEASKLFFPSGPIALRKDIDDLNKAAQSWRKKD